MKYAGFWTQRHNLPVYLIEPSVPDSVNIPLDPELVISFDVIKQAQKEDQELSKVMTYLATQQCPSRRQQTKEPRLVRSLHVLAKFDSLCMTNDTLCVKSEDSLLVVLHGSLKHTSALQWAHDKMGHFSIEKVTPLLRSRYFWPN